MWVSPTQRGEVLRDRGDDSVVGERLHQDEEAREEEKDAPVHRPEYLPSSAAEQKEEGRTQKGDLADPEGLFDSEGLQKIYRQNQHESEDDEQDREPSEAPVSGASATLLQQSDVLELTPGFVKLLLEEDC